MRPRKRNQEQKASGGTKAVVAVTQLMPELQKKPQPATGPVGNRVPAPVHRRDPSGVLWTAVCLKSL